MATPATTASFYSSTFTNQFFTPMEYFPQTNIKFFDSPNKAKMHDSIWENPIMKFEADFPYLKANLRETPESDRQWRRQQLDQPGPSSQYFYNNLQLKSFTKTPDIEPEDRKFLFWTPSTENLSVTDQHFPDFNSQQKRNDNADLSGSTCWSETESRQMSCSPETR